MNSLKTKPCFQVLVLVVITVAVFSAATRTEAKTRRAVSTSTLTKPNQILPSKRNSKLNRTPGNPICAKCSCTTLALDDAVGFPRCMRGCLADVGIGPYALIMCGATCFFGAVPLCAVCLGVAIAVVEACAIGCAAYPDGVGTVQNSAKNIKRRDVRTRRPQILRLLRAPGRTS